MEMEVFVNRKRKEVLIIPESASREKIEKIKERIKEQFRDFEIEIATAIDLFRREIIKEFLLARSLFDNKPLIEKLGFKLFYEYHYCLDSLDQVKKVLFNYALLGRRGKKGLLHILNGMKIAKGVVLIPSKNSCRFERFLKNWGIKYEKRIVIYEVI